MLRSLRTGFFLAMRSLRRGQRGLLITPVLVMIVTYVNLLFIPGLVRGAVVANQQKLQTTLTADYAIQPPVNEDNIEEVPKKIAAIQAMDGIQAVTSVLQVGNRITTADKGGYWTVLAVDPVSYRAVFKDNLQNGSFVDDSPQASIVLGSRIAGTSAENDSTTLGGIQTGGMVRVLVYGQGEHEYNVAGVFNNSFYDADVRAFISRASYETLKPESANQATKIFIKTRAGKLPAASLQQLQTIVGSGQIRHADESSSSFEEQASAYGDIGRIIAIMAILVSAIVIFTVTYIDLIQRRRQIGIQRAIGIRATTIVTSYVIRACISTILGILIGALVYKFAIAAYFDRHPLELRSGEVRLATTTAQYMGYALFLMTVSLFAALIPTFKETRLKLLNAIEGST